MTSRSQPSADAGPYSPRSPETQRVLDLVWRAVDVLGAPDTACITNEERAYCRAIGDALAEIEKLGGRWS